MQLHYEHRQHAVFEIPHIDSLHRLTSAFAARWSAGTVGTIPATNLPTAYAISERIRSFGLETDRCMLAIIWSLSSG